MPNSRGHTKVWESVSPTRGATPKCGGPHHQLEGPHRSVGVPIPISRARGVGGVQPPLMRPTHPRYLLGRAGGGSWGEGGVWHVT